ncbi:MAG: ABC transporter substrate-binding protein [Chloroflexota bacterium]
MPSLLSLTLGRRAKAVSAAALIVAFTLAPSAGAHGAARAASGPTGSLTLAIGFEPSSLDPAYDYEIGATSILANVYEGLVRDVGAKTVKVVPDLATSWKTSADGKTWTFKLRPNVKFHDGSNVDAAAVKFSFDRLAKNQLGAAAVFAEISSVQVVDPLTVAFHLQYPFASFLPSLATVWGADIVSPKTVGNHKINASNGTSYLDDHDAGSGPYELVSWVRHQKITLQAFPGYWGGWSGNHTKTVTLVWPPASSTGRLELEQGALDATDNLSPQDYAAVKQEQGINVLENTSQTIRDIRINAGKGALKNQLVRQALSYAFDYDGVIRGVFQGHASRMQGIGPTGFENFVQEPHLYTFDLNKAKSLLAKAGYAGKKLSFTLSYLPDDTQAQQMAEIYQADLAKIGITGTLKGVPIATYSLIARKPATNPDIWFGTWGMDYADDAEEYWTFYYSKNTPPYGSNVFFYNDPKTDSQLIAARKSTDPAAAYKLYTAIAHRIYNQALEIWPAQPNETVAVSAKVHGYAYNYMYGFFYYPLYNMYKS